jgi:glycerol-3-phosphate dehydrogenase
VGEARAERGPGQPSATLVRLVRGSHMVVPKLYDGDHAFILQNDDRRVIFMIPYGDLHTLVGTTDMPQLEANRRSRPSTRSTTCAAR